MAREQIPQRLQEQEFPHWFDGSAYTHRVARAIAKHGPIARTALAPMLGLSQGALSRITKDLIRQGVIEEITNADMAAHGSSRGTPTPAPLASHGPDPMHGALSEDSLTDAELTATASAPITGTTPTAPATATMLSGTSSTDLRRSSGRRGRPQTALALRADARTFIGVKVLGTSAVATTVNAHGEIISNGHELKLPLERTPEQVTAVIATLVRACRADLARADLVDADAADANPARAYRADHTQASTDDANHTDADLTDACQVDHADAGTAQTSPSRTHPSPTAVGVSLGGHVRDDTVVTFAPFLHWDGDVPLAAMVGRATGLPCRVCNDIDALLVDASWFGPGVGLEAFAVLTIGAGIGYSLAMRGQPVSYTDKSYGLLAHVLVDPEGPRCTAGHIGCAQCLTNDSLANQYSRMMGRACSFEDFARDVRADVPQAKQLANLTCFRLGTLIATIANIAMPSSVMVAGESAFLAQMGIDSIRDGISRYRRSQAQPVRFTVMDHDWRLWAKAAASCAIARYIG